MPNLRAGFVITASLPASTVLFTSELLTEGVAPIPLDGSTVVEGTVCPTIVSSPEDDTRGILAAGLEKQNTNQQTKCQKHSIVQKTSYLPIASSLGGATTLPCRSSSISLMPSLGIGTWSRAASPITPFSRRCLICTIKSGHQYCSYEISYEHTKI